LLDLRPFWGWLCVSVLRFIWEVVFDGKIVIIFTIQKYHIILLFWPSLGRRSQYFNSLPVTWTCTSCFTSKQNSCQLSQFPVAFLSWCFSCLWALWKIVVWHVWPSRSFVFLLGSFLNTIVQLGSFELYVRCSEKSFNVVMLIYLG